MAFLQALVLAIIQGLTEFLPISSSGHLHLVQSLLGLTPSLSFDIFLNTATLLSVLVYFRRQVGYFFHHLRFVIVGTLPAVFAGLFLKDQIEASFSHVHYLPYEFLATGLLLLATRFIRFSDKPLTYSRALLVGLAQALAILPAISRSGATLFAGLLLGLSPLNAFNLSFCLFIPASFGALILDFKDASLSSFMTPTYLFAFVVTFVVGLISLHYLRRLLTSGRLWYFSIYIFILSFVLFLFLAA